MMSPPVGFITLTSRSACIWRICNKRRSCKTLDKAALGRYQGGHGLQILLVAWHGQHEIRLIQH